MGGQTIKEEKMIRFIPFPMLLLATACGGGESTADRLEDAAEQSDPAAAQVLNNTAEALREQEGPAPPGTAQEALERAGEAQAQRDVETSSTLQAKPNLPQDPNRPTAGQPPKKIDVAEGSQDEQAGNAADEHAGHDMGNHQ